MWYYLVEKEIRDNKMENDLAEMNEIEEYILQDILQAIEEYVKCKDKKAIQFVRDLVQKGCLND